MKIIESNSPDLKALKAKAVADLDLQLLKKIREVDGMDFIFCQEFYHVVMATSIEDNQLPIIASTALEELLINTKNGGDI